MKIHLPVVLRSALLTLVSLPATSALLWDFGVWNTYDASWLLEGAPAVFSDGDSVQFTSAADSFIVEIEGTVQPLSMLVSSGNYVFSGNGSIGGDGQLTVLGGASVTMGNANSYSGGTVLESGSMATIGLFNGLGSISTSGFALGNIQGAGTLILALEGAATMASIQYDSLAAFTGTLNIQRGTLALGREPGHSGPGRMATLGAQLVEVGSEGAFILSLGGGKRGLDTGRLFSSSVRTVDGAVLGNRDGHVNWSGNVYLNVQNVSADVLQYDSQGETEMNFHYGKDVVWDGVVAGAGRLVLFTSHYDTGSDHRLILTNPQNSFSGTYSVNAEYTATLALASPQAAAAAGVELNTPQSRLVLMGCDAEIAAINGGDGCVQAEGDGAYRLSIGSGNFAGIVRDSASQVPGLSLGIAKTGSGSLQLNGSGCTYTGATIVSGGRLSFTGDVTLGNISLTSGEATFSVEGGLTLRAGAALVVNMESRTQALHAGGALNVSETAHSVLITGYEDLSQGAYDVLTWGTASSVSVRDFVVRGMSDTESLIYGARVQGNSLQLVVGDMAAVPWLWSGGSASWTDSSSAEWSNTTGAAPAGQAVTFSARDAGIVSLGLVTPSSVSVNGGEYTFVASGNGNSGIASSGTLSVSGNSTVLKMNLSNAGLSGSTELLGGILEIGVPEALGTSSIYFNGGTLRYGPGVTQDISAQINPGSLDMVKVDTNGNNVSWNQSTGVSVALAQGMVKDGGGTITLLWTAADDTYAGALTANEGTLQITKSGSTGTLSGRFSGSGTIQLSSLQGRLNINGDNSAFGGVVSLAGDGTRNSGGVCFADGHAMGGAATTVHFAGQRFWFNTAASCAADIVVGEGITYMDGSSGSSYAFSGSVSGTGTLELIPSSNITMTGDTSGFTGRFIHPGKAANNWQLGGAGISGSGQIRAELNAAGANMTYLIMYSGDTTLSGFVSGLASLRQGGGGVLILTGNNTSQGKLVIDPGCEVQLGSATQPAIWSGSVVSGGGKLTLVNGTLSSGLSTADAVLVADVAEDAVVHLGGMSANAFQEITIAAGGQLTGISGDLTVGSGGPVMSLTLAPENVGETAALAPSEQNMLGIAAGNLNVSDALSISIDMETIKHIINGERQAVYLHVSDADIVLQNGVTVSSLFANSATNPAALGLVALGVDGGNIVLEGAVTDVYMVTENGDYPTVTSYTRLQEYKATFVDAGYTLSLQLPGDNTQEAWVNNLLGSGNLDIRNTDQNQGVVRVLLNNTILGAADETLTPDEQLQIDTANTALEGNVTAGAGVQLVKTGSGRLTIGGALTAESLELEEGTLQLNGTENQVNILQGTGNLLLEDSLLIAGDSAAFDGFLSGDGELILNGSLSGKGTVGCLSGTGSLLGVGESLVVKNMQNGTFSGTLEKGSGGGVLTVRRGAGELTLSRIQGSSAWSIQNGGNLVLEQSGTANSPLTLGSLELFSGSQTSIVLNTDTSVEVFSLGSLTVEDGASVTLNTTGVYPVQQERLVLGQVETVDLGTDGKVILTLGDNVPFRDISAAWLEMEGNELVLRLLRRGENPYAEVAESYNGHAGARMLWTLTDETLKKSPDLSALTQAMGHLLQDGRNADADRLMSSAAGAAITAVANALSGDMERQLRSVRNRTTSMGLNPAYAYSDLPYVNAWINAEGDYQELSASGTDAGFRLNSWGGTVGCDLDFSTRLTAGLSLTAMYGDFESKGPARADGDLNTYYLTLFGRYVQNRWTHTFVAAVGWADSELNRYVSYGTGQYTTRGKTHGMGLGFLYELGYVIPLDENNTSCLQPVANLAISHVQMDAYNEHGSDAALHIGRQRMDAFTLGLGARYQTYALENLCNRSSLLEARALLKIDAGDRRGKSRVAFVAEPGASASVRSAEAGILGLELGAGITLPLGESGGHLFLDAGVQFRTDETEVNGTVGYRLQF